MATYNLYGTNSGKSRTYRPNFHRTIDIHDSDFVQSVQYDPTKAILDATLKTGQKYRYQNVSATRFAHLVTARSAGKAFNTFIKPLPYRKVGWTR